LPRPANLAEHEYTQTRLADALWNGVEGTAMSAWRDHSTEDLAALAQVVRGFQVAAPETDVPANLTTLGAAVYEANCVQCHGVAGDGRGSAADELVVAPTDFRNQRPSLNVSLRALRNGVEGTRMGTWTERLSAAELLAVANYVRGFYRGDAQSAGATGR
jgi:mono/diheme cytochrome c family protein